MSKRKLGFILLFSFIFLSTTGIPISSQYQIQCVDDNYALLTGRNVNMVSGTQLPDGDPWLQRQNEPSIAVSTRNPLHLLAGANDYRTIDIPGEITDELPGQEDDQIAQAPREPWLGVFKSFDGGQTWISLLLPGFPQDFTQDGLNSPLKIQGWHAAADPVVRAGANGLFYFSGIAFNRTTKEGVVFVSRFIDNNNNEKLDCIKYLDTKIIAQGLGGRFLDKPWIAVDKPRFPSWKTNVDGQHIPRHNIYIAFSVFTGEGASLESKIVFARSSNCGDTWSQPIQLSRGHFPYQGATIAIKPITGAVFVAWRKFGDVDQHNQAIYIAKSLFRGLSFRRPVKVASFYSFDQPSSGVTFRTNSYPTMAVDNTDRIYLAWSQRMGGPTAEARIVITTSRFGHMWTNPMPIDNSGVGHQVMPSLTFAGGKLMMVWYDQRNDISGDVYDKYIQEKSGQRRHTLDVRVAQAKPNRNPTFEPSVQVSRYLFALTGDGSSIYQVQFNPVNYPLFKLGTWPFMGDYIDIAPAPMFVMNRFGRWRFNTKPSNSTVFHVAWTDNRDVRPPPDYDWTTYNPPSSFQENPEFSTSNTCSGDWDRTGMRNQNVYTATITQGIIVGSPGNTKPLGTLGVTPEGERIPRAFVIFVRNTTNVDRSFRLIIANQPPNGSASFLEFEPLHELDVTVASRSSISRPVFVDSTDPNASVTINVIEIDAPYGVPLDGGLEGSVALNPDPTNPDIENPDIENPDILNYEVHNPDIENPDIVNWMYTNPDIVNPDIENPDILNPDIVNPDILNPDILNPDILNPDILNPDIENPDILNPDILNPGIEDPSSGQFTDVIWNVTNKGNTTSSYKFETLSTAADENGSLPGGIQAQLLIYKVYTTPFVDNSGSSNGDPCQLQEQEHQQLILNILNPDIENPDIENPDIENPDIENPDIMNATFSLAPDEKALVVLRLWDPGINSQATSRGMRALNSTPFNPLTDLIGTVGAHEGNTEDRQEGNYTNPGDADSLLIATESLDSGEVGQDYLQFLRAFGGNGDYNWQIISGSLPENLVLDPYTGKIDGNPTKAGTSGFTVLVTDTGAPQQSDTQHLSVTINPASGGEALSITTTSLPDGDMVSSYSQTLTATGGTGTLTWGVTIGYLPGGLNIIPSTGVIGGTATEAGNFSFTIEVTDQSTPPQSSTQALSLYIAPPPDFIVESLAHSPEEPFTTDTITFTAVVKNIGAGQAGASTLMFKIGGETAGSTQTRFVVPALASGASHTVIRQATLTAGSYINTAQADFDNIVAEPNENNNITTDSYTVLAPLPHTVSIPNTPSGPASGVTDISYSYTKGGSICSYGHSVEYQFDWGDSTQSSWSNSVSTSHSWSVAGTFIVKVQARCAEENSIESGWSSELTVTISSPNLVAYYPFIGNANDEGGNGLNGTVSGAALTTDRFGNADRAYSFDGQDDAITVADNSLLDINEQISLVAWIYPTQTKTQHIIRRSARITPPVPYGLSLSETNDIIFTLSPGGSFTQVRKTGYDLNKWSFIVGTYDGTTMKLYVNGTEVNLLSVSGFLNEDDAPLLIGTRLQLPADTFKGKLDDIRIYSRAFSTSEIDALYTQEIGGLRNDMGAYGGPYISIDYSSVVNKINVPGDYTTIQGAINAANPGDTVIVAPGTYYENVYMKDGVDLLGSGAEVTTIDAGGKNDVVNACVNNATISGFTLTNSGLSDLGHYNCGVYVHGSYSPTIRNNVIVSNQFGIGVWYGANPDIRNNIIKDNFDGFYVYGSDEEPSNPSIINNVIADNERTGILLRVKVSPTILNNIITGHLNGWWWEGTHYPNSCGINYNGVTGSPTLDYNDIWNNDANYIGTSAGTHDISADPKFIN
ncbi:MAG: LamG-like jellyroll fold domain-containing protein, partial [Candidatus Aminicenantaceae bacterium]